MSLSRTIWRLLGWDPPLEALPFEELATSYAHDPIEVFEEFQRRLNALVCEAVVDYLQRTTERVPSREDADEATERIFEEFFPQFASGQESMLLARFAGIVRNALDVAAFDKIRERYYRQLPIYCLSDERQRQALALLYQQGFDTEGGDPAEWLAERLGMREEQAERILAAANRAFARVVAKDYTAEELSEMTEGCLP